MQIAGAQHGYLFTCETAEAEGRPVTPIPELVLTRQAGGGAVPEGEQLYSRTVLHTVIDSRSAIVSRDARRERQWSASESVSEHRLRSLLCVPILLHADILGVLYLDNNEASGVFTLHEGQALARVVAGSDHSLRNGFRAQTLAITAVASSRIARSSS